MIRIGRLLRRTSPSSGGGLPSMWSMEKQRTSLDMLKSADNFEGKPEQVGGDDFRPTDGESWSRHAQRMCMSVYETKAQTDQQKNASDHGERAERVKTRVQHTVKDMEKMSQGGFHRGAAGNALKNISGLISPTGKKVQPSVLSGRLVALCFFSESERSKRFLQYLGEFQDCFKEDFIAVGVSIGKRELYHYTKSYGLHHLPHSNGADEVMSQANLKLFMSPLPVMHVVDGSNGAVITTNGLTDLLVHPDECMEKWACDEPVSSIFDYPLAQLKL